MGVVMVDAAAVGSCWSSGSRAVVKAPRVALRGSRDMGKAFGNRDLGVGCVSLKSTFFCGVEGHSAGREGLSPPPGGSLAPVRIQTALGGMCRSPFTLSQVSHLSGVTPVTCHYIALEGQLPDSIMC